MTVARRNTARARRDRWLPSSAGGDWIVEPAEIDEEHFDAETVKEALRIAEIAEARGGFLGKGNFGRAYAVPVHGRVVVVKLPVARDIHGRVWPAREQRQNFLHEAGVANELEALGVTLVPETVYVESEAGVPALVREYGDPVARITLEEFIVVEHGLVDIERMGWRVEDEIDLYRREDGSLFVGDVGIWHPAAVRPSGERERTDDSSLDYLLPRLAGRVLGLPWQKLPPLHLIEGATARAAKELSELEPETEGPPTKRQKAERHFAEMAVSSLRSKVETRHTLGFPVPPRALLVLDVAAARGL